MDNVGCNTLQESDHAVGGEKLLTGKDDQAYRSVSTHHHHFTVIGIMLLSGEAVLCVVIIAGKKEELPVMTGLDWNAINDTMNYDINEGDEVEFICVNSGTGNILPEGPCCQFRGKDIPVMKIEK